MEGLPVTVRTFDLGADKDLNEVERVAPNPALGLRAIRLCLAEPKMFLRQLRAILRASPYGNLKILIPMLSSVHEINQTLNLIEDAKRSLIEDNIAFDPKVPVGAMIEIPAAALLMNVFTRRFDYLSVGTNDLIQYTRAIDRTDDEVAHLYDPLHPAILNLLAHIIRASTRARVPVAVCGEMAGDVRMTRVLLGFGLRQFSMHPAHLLHVKQQVLKSDLAHAKTLAQKLLRGDDPEKMQGILDKLNG
jgi:phosphotransferase system enzyme I (PtsI)